jgi:hypothetical protein
MNRRRLFAAVVLAGGAGLALAAEDKPLTPVEARKKVGEKVTVEMTVRAAKDRLEKRGEIYLDSEENFRDEKNFAVVTTKAGAASLKEAGIDDPAGHFKDKKIRATGTVKEVSGVPRIEIDDAKQIRLVEGDSDRKPGTVSVAGTFCEEPANPFRRRGVTTIMVGREWKERPAGERRWRRECNRKRPASTPSSRAKRGGPPGRLSCGERAMSCGSWGCSRSPS